jgi:hypothetical protein
VTFSQNPDKVLCPSSQCESGAKLLGIVNAEGRVDLLQNALPIDQTFLDAAAEGRNPEGRFRFAGPCIENACRQWTGAKCGVIESVIYQIENVALSVDLKPCSIRETCRWFSQRGSIACNVCTYVVTEAVEYEHV